MISKITSNDLLDKGVVGLDDVPGLSTTDMQKKFDEIALEVLVPKINSIIDELAANGADSIGGTDYMGSHVTVAEHLASTQNPHNTNANQIGAYTKAETNNAIATAIAQAIIEAGAGDMVKAVYDPQGKAQDVFAYAAPASHASAEDIHGKGTATDYGHVKLADAASESGADGGVAATPKAVNGAISTAESYADDLFASVNNKALPTGGDTDYVLAKASTINFDAKWVKKEKTVKCTLSAALWNGAVAPYVLTVDVPYATADCFPHIDGYVSSINDPSVTDAKAEDLARQEAASLITVVDPSAGKLTFICDEDKPTKTVEVYVGGVY